MALTVTKATYNIWQRKKAAIDAKQSPMQEQNAPKKTTLTDNAAHGAVEIGPVLYCQQETPFAHLSQ